jgi:hypothetical protein
VDDTSIKPQVSWQEILRYLPRIQSGENGVARTPIFVQDLNLFFDPESQEFVLSRERFGYMHAEEVRRSSIHDLEAGFVKFIIQYYQGELEAAVRVATYNTFLQLCMQIPYSQECTCADSEHGLMAADCHVHYDDPVHFVGDYSFACTCGEQNIPR